jgi:hypothetical protein
MCNIEAGQQGGEIVKCTTPAPTAFALRILHPEIE